MTKILDCGETDGCGGSCYTCSTTCKVSKRLSDIDRSCTYVHVSFERNICCYIHERGEQLSQTHSQKLLVYQNRKPQPQITPLHSSLNDLERPCVQLLISPSTVSWVMFINGTDSRKDGNYLNFPLLFKLLLFHLNILLSVVVTRHRKDANDVNYLWYTFRVLLSSLVRLLKNIYLVWGSMEGVENSEKERLGDRNKIFFIIPLFVWQATNDISS